MQMLKHLFAILIPASALALLIGVFHYESLAGSNIEKAQSQSGQNHRCPPGQIFQGGKCV